MSFNMKFFFAISSVLIARVRGAGLGNFFTYFDEGGLGPSRWQYLSIPDNQCGGTNGASGYGQSPVTISQSVASKCDTDMSAYQFSAGNCTWNDMDFSINNHGVVVSIKAPSSCVFGQMNIPHTPNKFTALQFHIHTYSEHQIEGDGDNGFFPAELHVVHQEETKQSFAVFGTMIALSSNDTAHDKFEWFLRGWEKVATGVANSCPASSTRRHLATTVVQQKVQCNATNTYPYPQTNLSFPNGTLDPYSLPTESNWGVYTYKGGLTTPGCTEIVNWNLLDKSMKISKAQLARLEYLILCYVQKNSVSGGTTVQSCQYATVASQSGSTSRPPQLLLGRTVLHRCRVGPSVNITDVGVKNSSDGFVKPQPVPEKFDSSSQPKCGRTLRDVCYNDKRYNPQVSPKLKANNPAWYDIEGYWVGSKKSFDNEGNPTKEVFASSRFKNTLPYPQDSVTVFVRRTVVGTRYYETVFNVLRPARAAFCNYPVPEESSNVLGNGTCGTTGYVTVGEKFGIATFEKDGSAKIFYSSGRYGNSTSGKIMPIDQDTFFSTVAGDDFEYTESFGISNAKKTRLSGNGQFYIRSSYPPFSDHPLAESYTYELNQVDATTFQTLLQQSYKANNVTYADQKIFSPNATCVNVPNCPAEQQFRALDPLYNASPYSANYKVTSGWIAFFTSAGVFLFLIVIGVVLFVLYKQNADFYRNEFTRRIAKNMKTDGQNKLDKTQLEEEFRKMDKDGDGVVTKDDLRSFMGNMMNDRDFDVMFAAIDGDHDGRIEFNDFANFMSQIGAVNENGGFNN